LCFFFFFFFFWFLLIATSVSPDARRPRSTPTVTGVFVKNRKVVQWALAKGFLPTPLIFAPFFSHFLAGRASCDGPGDVPLFFIDLFFSLLISGKTLLINRPLGPVSTRQVPINYLNGPSSQLLRNDTLPQYEHSPLFFFSHPLFYFAPPLPPSLVRVVPDP